ncbi:MAG: hypothetical protein O6940_02485 [Ignavibacteria bacterium]|nr:hypothetical protein [Ignavibacteria bacterium]
MRTLIFQLFLLGIPLISYAEENISGGTESIHPIYVNLGILGIVVALFAIFAGQYVRIIAEVTVRKEVSRARAELKAILQFQDALKYYMNNPEVAIKLSEQALPYLTGIELVQAKSNLAYYYASGSYWESKNRATELAKEILVETFIYPDRANNLKINYGYVIMKYAETAPETNRAINFLDNLKSIPSLKLTEIQEIDEYLSEARTKLSTLP